MGLITGDSGTTQYFIEFAGIGLTAALFPDVKDAHKGEWSRIPQAVAKFLQYQAPKVRLTLDDQQPLTVETYLVTLSNAPSFGLTFMVAPEAELEDGWLDVIVYPELSKPELITYFTAISVGGHSDNPKVKRYRARRVRIETKPPQEALCDGWPLPADQYTVQLVHKALRVITPRESGLAKDPSAWRRLG